MDSLASIYGPPCKYCRREFHMEKHDESSSGLTMSNMREMRVPWAIFKIAHYSICSVSWNSMEYTENRLKFERS